MPLDGIVRAIREQAREECDALTGEARERADALRVNARVALDAEAERYVASKRAEAEREATRALHRARIANGRALSDVRARTFERLRAEALHRLADLRGDPCYDELMSGLCRDAMAGLGDKVTVHVDPADEQRARAYLAAHGLGADVAAVATDITTIGGVMVSSADGRITRDNTFEARLTRVLEQDTDEIWEVLER